MTTYAITATVEYRQVSGWSGSRQVPTFYLDSDVQGITDTAGAERIARDIVTGAGLLDQLPGDVTVHATAIDVTERTEQDIIDAGPPYTINGSEHCAGCGEVAFGECVCLESISDTD